MAPHLLRLLLRRHLRCHRRRPEDFHPDDQIGHGTLAIPEQRTEAFHVDIV
jgi:hypothetical protein